MSISIFTLIAFWLVLAIVFAAVELATVGLVSIWFAAGAFAALLIAVLHGNLILQEQCENIVAVEHETQVFFIATINGKQGVYDNKGSKIITLI